ncbi:MAG: hypothetical protein WKF54_00920 [Nocardioidaceae bacterium]
MPQRHATDVVSLVFGTVFAGFTLVWLVGVTGHLDHDDSWWAGPVVLVVAGLAGLVASLRRRGPAELPPNGASSA